MEKGETEAEILVSDTGDITIKNVKEWPKISVFINIKHPERQGASIILSFVNVEIS